MDSEPISSLVTLSEWEELGIRGRIIETVASRPNLEADLLISDLETENDRGCERKSLHSILERSPAGKSGFATLRGFGNFAVQNQNDSHPIRATHLTGRRTSGASFDAATSRTIA